MRGNDAGLIGFLLMDPGASVWWDGTMFAALSYTEGGREIVPFFPALAAFRPDLATARKDAAAISKQQKVDVRPVRVAFLCR